MITHKPEAPQQAFYKASGGGNDFILLPPGAAEPSAAQIRAWCRRGLSIGADGVIRLQEADGGARMTYWNSDGGRSDLCLNGSRCAARLAFDLGWGEHGHLTLHTDVGALGCRRRGPASVEITLPASLAPDPTPASLVVEGQVHDGWYLTVGVPHFVLPWPSLGTLPITHLGPALRHHPELPQGANINFVAFPEAARKNSTGRHCSEEPAPESRFDIRTWERGVEAETLACGTGLVAAGLVGVAMGSLSWPTRGLTAGGFELSLEQDTEQAGSPLRLVGDARLVAKGHISLEAELLPGPPSWSPIS